MSRSVLDKVCKKGVHTVFSVLLLIITVAICVTILMVFCINWVGTQVEKLNNIDFCKIELKTWKYYSSSKKLVLALNSIPYPCEIKIYVVKDNNVKCKMEGVEVNEPYTEITISNCHLTSGKYVIEYYTMNNIPVGKNEIIINN